MSTPSRRRSATDRSSTSKGRGRRPRPSSSPLSAHDAKTPRGTSSRPASRFQPPRHGLWQIADMERDGRKLDPDPLGATTWRPMPKPASTRSTWPITMAAPRMIAGRFNALSRGERGGKAPVALHQMVPDARADDGRDRVARGGGARACERLRRRRSICCSSTGGRSEHPGWIDAMKEMARLKRRGADRPSRHRPISIPLICALLIDHGIPVVTNQVCFSLLDRRAAGRCATLCRQTGVQPACLWHAVPAAFSPRNGWASREPEHEIADWSTMKYMRFVDAIGGWDVLQSILDALAGDCAQARRFDRQCRDALGAGARGGRPRSSSARGSASASTAPTISRYSASRSMRKTARCIDAALSRATADPGRLRR